MDHEFIYPTKVVEMSGCQKKYVAFTAVGLVLAAFGGAMFPFVDYFIKEEIKRKVIISNTSQLYDVWQNNPIPVYLQFWIFDVKNVKEVLNGAKPLLAQRGPYTYREHRIKFDIVWNPNGTMTYRQNRTFHFTPEMSVGSESDMFHTINPLMATVAQAIKWLPADIKAVVSLAISATGADGMFTHRNVSQLLWGYDDPTLVLLNKIIPLWFNETLTGFFIRKNSTDDGLYTVETGERDIDKLGGISEYNGQRHVDIWTTEWANMVNGTDGTLGPPFRFDAKTSPMFTSDLCRSISGVYREDVESPQGISLRRFTGDKNQMVNASVNPDNIGFCTPQSKCLPSGLLNSTLCQLPVDRFMIPLIFSFPHFLDADPQIQGSVYGLSPKREEHETTIDIEPWTGLVMQVAKRVQINFYVEGLPEIVQTEKMRELFFPILWLNESVVIDDKHAAMIQNQLFLPMKITLGVEIGFLVIGGLLVLVAFSLCYRRRHKHFKMAEVNDKLYPTSSSPVPVYDDPGPNHTQAADVEGKVNQYEVDDQLLTNHDGYDDHDKLLDPSIPEQ